MILNWYRLETSVYLLDPIDIWLISSKITKNILLQETTSIAQNGKNMLQIISGKFYESDDRFKSDGKGIFFSNYSWIKPIKTCVATLEPVDTQGSVSSYVISYLNQIEKKPPPEKNIIVRIGDAEIVEQFMIVCSFSLGAFFHQDRSVVATTCRDQQFSNSDYCIPSQFVPRIFSRQIHGKMEDADNLSDFVNDLIGLERQNYTALMKSLRCFYDAMQMVGNNIDLAYSLLIYSIEALAQRTDSFQPTWDDYPQDIRQNLNPIFYEIDADCVKTNPKHWERR